VVVDGGWTTTLPSSPTSSPPRRPPPSTSRPAAAADSCDGAAAAAVGTAGTAGGRATAPDARVDPPIAVRRAARAARHRTEAIQPASASEGVKRKINVSTRWKVMLWRGGWSRRRRGGYRRRKLPSIFFPLPQNHTRRRHAPCARAPPEYGTGLPTQKAPPCLACATRAALGQGSRRGGVFGTGGIFGAMLQINVGQAGGQIGAVCASYMGPPTRDGHGCLFIDSEPKVRRPCSLLVRLRPSPPLPSPTSSSSSFPILGRARRSSRPSPPKAARTGSPFCPRPPRYGT
jgi:hypothetical protein